jgi:hypothetical protein
MAAWRSFIFLKDSAKRRLTTILNGIRIIAIIVAALVCYSGCKEPPGRHQTDQAKVSQSFAFSNYSFTYENWMEPKVWKLRQQENLDQVISSSKTELEIFETLTLWARRQFEPGFPDPYPPSNGIDILTDIRSGKTKGFCGQYSYLLGDALKSLGFFDVRYVEIWKDPQTSHFLVEAWSNQLRRWMLLDPLHAAAVVDQKGNPVSAWDVHAAVAAGQQSTLHRKWLAAEKEVPRSEDSTYFQLYRLVAISLRNDLAAADHPWTIKERERDFLAIQSKFLKGPYHSSSSRQADFESPRNVCGILINPDPKGTMVELSNAGTCPHFHYFEVNLNGSGWKKSAEIFVSADPVKSLQCRTVNKMGIRGATAKYEETGS